MTTLFSYLLTFLAIIFWIFRAIATVFYQKGTEFFAEPLNETLEIVVLFATLPCLLLVLKRSIVGATAYFGIYGAYFGTALYNNIVQMMEAETASLVSISDTLILACGVIIPFLTFLDIALNRHRGNFNADAKTRWFYKDEKYDREFDERADRNQYKL